MATKIVFAVTAFHASMSGLVYARMPQDATNGNCTWGTPDAPVFPNFLENNPLPGGFPWGDRSSKDNRPYSSDTPVTEVTRYYEFDIRRGMLAPDGYQKSVILVNGQFPGPPLEANWGDWIEVRVNNNIENELGDEAEGTAIHFHGISQMGTPWFDGVPGVSQCPIAPGSSFTHRFRADVYGTSWWHSHFSAQYTAGIFGPLIIYGPKHVDYDVDLGPIMLGDWYHSEYHDVVEATAGNSSDINVYVPWSDNSLINGKNNYNCTSDTRAPTAACDPQAGLAQFRFQPGKTHLLRLMNTGAAAMVHFSIDGHTMNVVANDFEPLVSYEAEFISLHVGQRTDVLVKADADPEATYWMRSTITRNCSVTYNPEALAIIGYDGHIGAGELSTPNSTMTAAAAAADQKSFLCRNDDLSKTVPYFPQAFEPNPDTVETIVVDYPANATGHHVWTMNNVTQYTDYNSPTLLQAYESNFSFPAPHANVYDFGSNRTVRIVLNTVLQAVHPMHLHGHAFQVLAEGPGPWDGNTEFFAANPLRRDTHVQRRFGHLVIQFTLDNPGVWSYHCHIAWHSAMGFTMVFLERPLELAKTEVPFVINQTCVDWDKWTNDHVVAQIDAGI